MDLKYEFLKILELTNDKFYVPTEEHSSGFNQIEIYDMEDGTFSITEENGCCVDKYLTFEEILAEYPKFTLSREFAFYNKFETWDRLEKALKGEIEIKLLEI